MWVQISCKSQVTRVHTIFHAWHWICDFVIIDKRNEIQNCINFLITCLEQVNRHYNLSWMNLEQVWQLGHGISTPVYVTSIIYDFLHCYKLTPVEFQVPVSFLIHQAPLWTLKQLSDPPTLKSLSILTECWSHQDWSICYWKWHLHNF